MAARADIPVKLVQANDQGTLTKIPADGTLQMQMNSGGKSLLIIKTGTIGVTPTITVKGVQDTLHINKDLVLNIEADKMYVMGLLRFEQFGQSGGKFNVDFSDDTAVDCYGLRLIV